jgi:predicted anti-sigma-YlaC factor YlaD
VPSWHCVCLGVDSSAANRGGHVQLLLGAYLLGGLTASQEVAVRAHLERCGRCRAEHDELAVVPSWLDLLPPEELSSDRETPEGS